MVALRIAADRSAWMDTRSKLFNAWMALI